MSASEIATNFTNVYGPREYAPRNGVSHTTLTTQQLKDLERMAKGRGHKVSSSGYADLEQALMADATLRAMAEDILKGRLILGSSQTVSSAKNTIWDSTAANGIIRLDTSKEPLPGAPANDNGSVSGSGSSTNGISGNNLDEIAKSFFTNILPPLDAKIAEAEKKAFDTNLSDAERQKAQHELQQLVQKRTELVAMMSNLLKSYHDMAMAIIQNLRV